MKLAQLPQNPLFRYLAPFVAFMAITECQRFGNETSIFWIYGAKVFITGAVIYFCFKSFKNEISGSFDIKAILLGLLVLAIWIAPDAFRPEQREISFNPTVFNSSLLLSLAVLIRIAGAVIIVPIVEELVWRSFLMRYLIKTDFQKVGLGTYSAFAFWITVGAFTLVHQSWEWPVAFITGILYGGYLVKTKNLLGCILAHATTNLGLAVYILITQKWYFW